MELVDVVSLDGATRSDVLRLAGAVEAASEHPIAQAVARAARAEVGELPPSRVPQPSRASASAASSTATRSRSGRSERRASTVAWDGEPRATLDRPRHRQADERRGGRAS